jgi:fatty acid CoA ligase FadD9
VIVETDPFTAEDGLLTAVGKPARRRLEEHYGERLETLYAEHDRVRDDRWRQLSARAGHQPVIETVCQAAAAVLGDTAEAPSPEHRFAELGGDSLSALTYASALSDLLGVEVSVDAVISPVNDLQAVADHIEARRRPEGAGPTFASVHGEGAATVYARDLTLDAFLDAVTLGGLSSLPAPSPEPRHVPPPATAAPASSDRVRPAGPCWSGASPAAEPWRETPCASRRRAGRSDLPGLPPGPDDGTFGPGGADSLEAG